MKRGISCDPYEGQSSINIIICSHRFVTQNDKNVEREKVNTSLVSIRTLVISLSSIACITGLLFISTTALAQNSSTGDILSEITAVERKIVPANSSTVKANVTILPLTNVTGI
ncbi:MAG TPA: hypothetical protein VGK47_00910 [Nitrososphaeraceae archaeon]